MKDIEIKISQETRMVDLKKTVIGNDAENLQGNLIFSFTDDFVNGTARLEYEIAGNKRYIMLEKNNNTYSVPIKSVLTKKGQIKVMDKEIPLSGLQEELTLLLGRAHEKTILVQADKEVPVQQVVTVFDTAKKLGAAKLGIGVVETR